MAKLRDSICKPDECKAIKMAADIITTLKAKLDMSRLNNQVMRDIFKQELGWDGNELLDFVQGYKAKLEDAEKENKKLVDVINEMCDDADEYAQRIVAEYQIDHNE